MMRVGIGIGAVISLGLAACGSPAERDAGPRTAAHAGHGAATEEHARHAAPAASDHEVHDHDATHGPAAGGPSPAGPHAGHTQAPAAGTGVRHDHAHGSPTSAAPSGTPVDEHAGHHPARAHAHPATSPAQEAGLASLVEALLDDPAVQQRIQQDVELRRLWDEPAVRSQLDAAPRAVEGMAKLLELVGALTADPAVQRQIEADAALRELWAEPGVRQRMRATGHP